MAILKDFLDQVSFSDIWAMVGAENPDMAQYEESYRSIFEELKAAEPAENKENMTIRFVMEEPQWTFFFGEEETESENDEAGDEDEAVLQVYGFIPGDEEGYAIGLKPAAVLVGLTVDEETARDYTPAEIVAHCMAEMTYTSTMAQSAYGMEKDMAGGGLLASQSCMSEDIQNVDLDALRAELGVLPKPEEDYKTKYGFLF